MITHESTIMITGASDGLGKAISLLVAQKYGCPLAICGRDEGKLREVIRLINDIDPEIKVFAACFDMTQDEDCLSFIENAKEALGSFDILINNAGANIKKDYVENIQIEDLRYMLNLNCVSPLIFTQALLKDMKEKREGHIINILSSVCKHSIESSAAYSASKQAYDIISQILLKEVRENHVKVTNVYPGGIDTNFRSNDRPDYMKPESVALAICSVMEMSDDSVIHELVLRPFVENNF